jgi:hypothetical protein
MKKFILNLIFLCFCLFLVGYWLSSLKKYRLYGDYFIRQKVNYYNKHSDKYNTVVFGSSRMYRQMQPGLLDSATLHKIKAYNLATGGTFFSESMYVFRQININKNIKYIIFEIQDVQPFDINAYTEKFLYCHDFSTVNFELKYFINDHDWNSSFLSVSHFLANIFYLKKLGQRDKPQNEFVNYNNGFYPLEKDYEKLLKVKELRLQYLQDTTFISRDNKNFEKTVKKKLNPALVDELGLLAKECKSKGIKLILILPPFAKPTELSELRKIPNAKILDFSSRNKFKELYSPGNVYDYGHLSAKGSAVFTMKLADSLNHFIK